MSLGIGYVKILLHWRPRPDSTATPWKGYSGANRLENLIKNKEMKMARGQSLQDPFLNTLRKERVPVSIYLVNGIKLQGQIDSFDQFVVLLKNSVSQMVYKHAISTVVPARNIRVPSGDEETTTPAPTE